MFQACAVAAGDGAPAMEQQHGGGVVAQIPGVALAPAAAQRCDAALVAGGGGTWSPWVPGIPAFEGARGARGVGSWPRANEGCLQGLRRVWRVRGRAPIMGRLLGLRAMVQWANRPRRGAIVAPAKAMVGGWMVVVGVAKITPRARARSRRGGQGAGVLERAPSAQGSRMGSTPRAGNPWLTVQPQAGSPSG